MYSLSETAVFPTLLCPCSPLGDVIGSPKSRRRAPECLTIPDENADLNVRIKNIFMDVVLDRAPSLEGTTKKTPCVPLELETLILEEITETPIPSPLGIQTPCRLNTPPLPLVDCNQRSLQTFMTGPAPLVQHAYSDCLSTSLATSQQLACSQPVAQSHASLHYSPQLQQLDFMFNSSTSRPHYAVAQDHPHMMCPVPHQMHGWSAQAPLAWTQPEYSISHSTEAVAVLGHSVQYHATSAIGALARPVLSLDYLVGQVPFSHLSCQSQPAVESLPHYQDFISAPLASVATACLDRPLLPRPPAPPCQAPAPAADSSVVARLGLSLSSAPPPPPPPPSKFVPSAPILASVGSAEHGSGNCKPCAFLHKQGCENGAACGFCHTCGPDEIKRRKKQKAEFRKMQKAVVSTNNVDQEFAANGLVRCA